MPKFRSPTRVAATKTSPTRRPVPIRGFWQAPAAPATAAGRAGPGRDERLVTHLLRWSRNRGPPGRPGAILTRMSNQRFTSGPAIVGYLAAVRVAVHLATATTYGFFIDELYFLA